MAMAEMQNAWHFYLSTAHLHCQLRPICVVFLIAAARWLHLVRRNGLNVSAPSNVLREDALGGCINVSSRIR